MGRSGMYDTLEGALAAYRELSAKKCRQIGGVMMEEQRGDRERPVQVPPILERLIAARGKPLGDALVHRRFVELVVRTLGDVARDPELRQHGYPEVEAATIADQAWSQMTVDQLMTAAEAAYVGICNANTVRQEPHLFFGRPGFAASVLVSSDDPPLLWPLPFVVAVAVAGESANL